MSLAFRNPVHINGGLIFGPQDYLAAPAAFGGVSVLSVLRLRGGFPGVAVDNNGFMSNDVDPDGDPLSYRIISSVSSGTLTTHLGGAFTYVPNPGFVGVDSFVYQVYAGGQAGNIATVTITVDGLFNGVGVQGQLRLRAAPATLAFTQDLYAAPSRLRWRAAPPVASFGSALIVAPGYMRLRALPATLSVSGNSNQLVNGDFSAPDISPWILGPNTLATIVNGQVRLSAIAASTTPIYIYQPVLTVAGTPYTLDADVIPGVGFGAAGINVAETLIGSGGNLSYGGHITAVYNATSWQAFVALHYLVSDPAEYVLFDNVGLVGLTSVVSANLQGVVSRLQLRSAASVLSIQGADIPTVTFQLGAAVEKKRRKKLLEEETSVVLTIRFYDRGGVAVVPLSAIYQVDCPTTGTAVRAETALLPAAQIALTLTAADNAIVDQGNVRELRRVTIEAVLPGGDTVNAQYDYLVRNLSGVV